MLDQSHHLADAARFIEQGSFGDAAELLGSLADQAGSDELRSLIDGARVLCRAGSAHQSTAEHLEAAAREQRVHELLMRTRVLALLSPVEAPMESTREPPIASKPTRRRRFWRRVPGGSVTPADAGAGAQPAPSPTPPRSAAEPALPRPAHPALLTASGSEPATPWSPVPAEPSESDVVARVLGSLQVSVFGRAVRDWGSLKGRSVLQYLLLSEGRPVRRETLMELLWPGHSHASARNNLNVALYALRRAVFPRDLGHGPYIEYHQGSYLLGTRVSWRVDRDEFTQWWMQAGAAQSEGDIAAARSALERASALYRGRLFEDDPNGEWFFAEQRVLEERYLVVLERLASLQLEAGEVELAESTLQRAAARDACRESTHRLLMRCYAELHQHQLVSRQFHLCVEALRRELDVHPHPETVATFRALMGEAR